MSTTPRRIEYAGPEAWTVWGDEDGVHVRTPQGDGLESSDLTALIALVHEVRDQFASRTIPTPAPPDAEERRRMYGAHREEYDAKRASRAVYRALAPSADAPF